MSKQKLKRPAAIALFHLLALVTITIVMTTGLVAGRLDISDAAIEEFLATAFQYDYTKITDEIGLRDFVDVLDHQFAIIEYRQRMEFVGDPDSTFGRQTYKSDLEDRYRQLLRDGFIFKNFTEWEQTTTDPVNRAFIDFYLARRNALMADPAVIGAARELSQRIADRLYTFHFKVGQQKYNPSDLVRILFTGEDMPLARRLHRLLNDSAAVLSSDAVRLYEMYNKIGQQRGHRTSMDYSLSRLSYRKPEWLRIADDLKVATAAEYDRSLQWVKQEAGIDNPALFEIEKRLVDGAALPDRYFTPEKVDSALNRLLAGLGFRDLMEKLTIRDIDSGGYAALAIRLDPPYDNMLLKSDEGGFTYYRRLAAEIGRVTAWAYADTTLPYLLRDYPIGSEEMLTQLFESLALDKDFLADNFALPADDLERFETRRRWLDVFRIRQILVFFYFDYYLSNELASDPPRLYAALQDSLLDVRDSSHEWIETLITGKLESFPERLANTFCLIKTREILHRRFGDDYAANPEAGRFLIESFCRPGRSQTIEQYIAVNAPDRLSVKDIERQMHLR